MRSITKRRKPTGRSAAIRRPLHPPQKRGDISIRRMFTSHYEGYGADVLRVPPTTYVEVSERELGRGWALTGGGQFYSLGDGYTDDSGVTWGVVEGLFDDDDGAYKAQPRSRIDRRRPTSKR